MSEIIIEDGGRYSHDPSDAKVYEFDWGTNNLATAAKAVTSKFKLDTVSGVVLEKTVTSITRSSTTATVVCPSHGFATNDSITMAGASPAGGATPSEYNGTFTITKIDADTFSYTVANAPATPATVDVNASAITAVKGLDSLSIATDGKSTQFRFTVYSAGVDGSVYRISNLIVDDESPAQAKERSFYLQIQNR